LTGPDAAVALPEASAALPARIVIPLVYTKRTRIAAACSHLGAGAMLFMLGVEGVTHPGHHPAGIAWLSLAVGAAYLVTVVREIRHIRRGHHEQAGVAWVELLAGLVLVVEGIHRLKPGRIFGAASFVILTGLLTVGLGFIKPKLEAACRFEADGEGFLFKPRPWRGYRYRWDQLAVCRPSPDRKRLVVETVSGKRNMFRMRRLENRERIFTEIAARFPAEITPAS